MNNKFFGFFLVFVFGLFFSSPKVVLSQYYSQGESKAQLVVDKQLRPITDSKFFDNVDSKIKLFGEGEQVEYKILVKNSGNVDLGEVIVTDKLPAYQSLIFFPGEFVSSENKIVFKIDGLKIGETKEYLIRSKLTNLPVATGSSQKLKLVNQVTAVSGNLADSDTASFYVNKVSVPNTGAGDVLTRTALVLLFVSSGFGVRRLVRGY